MEKGQLDLSKPLLSARRIPKLAYRSAVSGEIVRRPQAERLLVPPPCQYLGLNKMEQVIKTAAVPFMWEHIPGRAKSKSGPICFALNDHPSINASVPPKQFEPYLVKKFSNAKKRPQLKQYKSSIGPHVSLDLVDNQSKSDDESRDSPSDVSIRTHGFLPRICLKNSLAIVSYFKDTKSRNRCPGVPRNEVRKLTKSPSTQLATPTQVIDKHVQEALQRRILVRKAEQQKLVEANRDKQIDEFINAIASHKDNKITHGNSVPGNISLYWKQRHPCPFREGAGFLGIPKEAEKSKANDSGLNLNNGTSRKFHDVSPPVEKALYADLVNPVKESDFDQDEVVKREVQHVELSKKKTIGPEFVPHVMQRLKEFSFSKHEATHSFVVRDHKVTDPGMNRKPDSFEKVSAEERLEVAKEQYAIDHAETDFALVASPRPPPLPKLPSESWLWRTLPSVTSKNGFSGLKKQSTKAASPISISEVEDNCKELQAAR
ncbi:unnamed protein product [Rhodiola kirilowii]